MTPPRSDTDAEADRDYVRLHCPGATILRDLRYPREWVVMQGSRPISRSFDRDLAWKIAAYHVARSRGRN